ncbi:MAG TPA: hypothetical protein VEB63_03040 [Chitinophagaceae bacterium]|nr:hypothetical protein [Chitinophagaceae bacterium]
MGAVPAGGNVWKTIGIGVLTTVLAYTIVNLIFEKRKEHKKKKQATVGAWKAIVKSNEFFLDDFYSELCRKDMAQMSKNLQRAVDKQISDYELMQKKPDLDEDLALYINRYIDRCRDMKSIMDDYFNARTAVSSDSGITEFQRTQKLLDVENEYVPRFTGLLSQDSAKIELLHQELRDKYGNAFQPLELPAVSVNKITGTWGDGKIRFRFDADHSFLMTDAENQQYRGRWTLEQNTLTLRFDGNSVTYHIVHYGKDYLRFTVNEMTDVRQVCRQ